MAHQRTKRISPDEQRRLAAREPFRKGTLIEGHLQVLGELGRGAAGVVYRVRDRRDGREMALKIFPGTGGAGNMARIRKEAEALFRLDHPGIAKIHGLVEHEGHPGILSERIEGATLQEFVARSGTVAPGEALEIFVDLLKALRSSHGQSVLHRDIKPSNIMVLDPEDGARRSSRVVLLDFGLARLVDEASLTATGELLGTPHYMAPEQAEDPRRADVRTDLYSAAVVLFFMLEGFAPFDADSPLGVLAMHRLAPVPVLKRGPIQARWVLDSLVRRGMGKRPERRWADADSAIQEAERARLRLADMGALERVRAGAVLRLRELLSRTWARRILSPVGLAALAALAVMGSLLLWGPLQPKGAVAELAVRNNRLIASDASGSQLWSYGPGGSLDLDRLEDADRSLMMIADLDSDGSNEIVFASPQLFPDQHPPELHLLSQDGSLEWKLRPGRTVRWGAGEMEDAYVPMRMRMLPPGPDGRRDILLVSTAKTMSPTQLLRVDPAGRSRGEWWNHGVMEFLLLRDLDGDRWPEILLGGYSNTFDCGGLAVLKADHLSGGSPARQGGGTVFHDMPGGSQLAYIVFPKNEIQAPLLSQAKVRSITEPPGGGFRVTAGEDGCEIFYDFRDDLTLERIFEASTCAAAHARLEARGALDHAYSPREPAMTPAPLFWDGSGLTAASSPGPAGEAL